MSDEVENALSELKEKEVFSEDTRFELRLIQGVEIRKLHKDNPMYSKLISRVPISEIPFPAVDAEGKETILAALSQPSQFLSRFSQAQAKRPRGQRGGQQ